MKKYMTSIGQKTGTLKMSKQVQIDAITIDLEAEYQNLNSGSLLMKGLNSSLAFVGSVGPSSVSSVITGSIFGVRNAIKRFN